ncbi:sulfurtransferase TusA family protein [Thermophilibacter immobilis]|jgi:TusA-related sulfurtransferase|uniref:Sulfurtransferase TusA family protein n=1 Tax=Thermophilibacter immobilis TaxID=2779519 RepID=A0A7S7RUA3_9ACTN|nr:sulfurtransferase TusA family protein [Thermophilibacter immobilis]QOY60242.1 sulfurtransferase TusA family protein [Thermophilibacter immobilis]
METLDARGLSCPEPVVMMSRALEKKPDFCRMVVDAPAPRENVTRYAEHQGYQVSMSESDGEWTLDVTKA